MSGRQQYKVRVHYTLAKPEAGLRFIKKKASNSYMYSFQAASGSGSVLCGGAGARCWFPCIDAPGVVCPMDNHFTVRTGQLVVSSGVATGIKALKDDWTTFSFKVSTPIAAHALGLAAGCFHLTRDPSSGANKPGAAGIRHGCPIGREGALAHCVLGGPSSKLVGRKRKRKFAQVGGRASHRATTVCMAIENTEGLLKAEYPQSKFAAANNATPSQPQDSTTTTTTATQPASAQHTPQHTQLFVEGLEARGPHRADRSGSLVSTDFAAFAGLVLVRAELLHESDAACPADARGLHLEVTQINGVVAQWFGCSVDVCQWTDAWIQAALMGFVTRWFLTTQMSLNREQSLFRLNNAVADAELNPHAELRPLCPAPSAIWLAEANVVGSGVHCALKAPYVMLMIFNRHRENEHKHNEFRSILQSFITRGTIAAEKPLRPLLDTPGVLERLKSYTDGGKGADDLTRTFAERWIYKNGVACLRVSFKFERKSNRICFVLEQKPPRRRFHILSGIKVALQIVEKEGADDTYFITMNRKQDTKMFKLRSKNRKQRVKRGEAEGFGDMLNDTPIKEVHVDPHCRFLRRVSFVQESKLWFSYLQKLSKDSSEALMAQLEALNGLARNGDCNKQQIKCVRDIVDGRQGKDPTKIATQVRVGAAWALARLHITCKEAGIRANVKNKWRELMVAHFGPTAFERRAMAHPETFEFKKELLAAFSSMRDQDNFAPSANLEMAFKLFFQGNDAGKKCYNEKYLRCMLAALTHIAVFQRDHSKDKEVVRELKRVLNYTTRVVPSYRGLVGSLCLRCLCELEVVREIVRRRAPSHAQYHAYAGPQHPPAVRVAALQCVVRSYLRAGATHPLPASAATTNYAEGMANQRRHDQEQWRKAFLWVLGQLGCAPEGTKAVTPLPASLRHLVWDEVVRVCVFDDLSGGPSERAERGIALSGGPCKDLADDIADDEAAEEGADGEDAAIKSPRVGGGRRSGKRKVRPTDIYRFDTHAHALRHLRARTPEFRALLEHLWRQLSQGTGLCPKARFSLYRVLRAVGNSVRDSQASATTYPEPLRTWQLEADTVVDPLSRYINESKIMKLQQLEQEPRPVLGEGRKYMPVHKILRLYNGRYRMATPPDPAKLAKKELMDMVALGRVQIKIPFPKPKPVVQLV